MRNFLILIIVLLSSLPCSAGEYRVWQKIGSVWQKGLNSYSSKEIAESVRSFNEIGGYESIILPEGQIPSQNSSQKLDSLDTLSRRYYGSPQTSILPDIDIASTLRRIEKRLDDIESRQANYETRVSALEKGSVVPFRSPSVLTDPIAAGVAGRVAGQYNQFGQYVPPTTYLPMLPVSQPIYPAPMLPVYPTSSLPLQQRSFTPVRTFFRAITGRCSCGN